MPRLLPVTIAMADDTDIRALLLFSQQDLGEVGTGDKRRSYDMTIPAVEIIIIDRLAALSLFVRLVERGSLGAAAADLRISRPAATAAIKALE